MTRVRAFLTAVLLCASGGLAFAYDPTSLSRDEVRCELSTSRAVGRAWAHMAKCQARCDAGALAGKNAASDCELPWGGATLGCINMAKAKARATITSKCASACPSCYDSGNNCDAQNHLDQWVAKDINGNRPDVGVEIFVSLHYSNELSCADQNTLTPTEAKCREAVDVLVGKHVAAVLKCLGRCRAAQAKGALPLDPDPCVPPSTESNTAACYGAARDKFEARCGSACADPPDCAPGFALCFDWASAAEADAFYYDRIPAPFPTEGESLVFCPSPSGAFLDE